MDDLADDDIGYLCDDPRCELGTGGLGLTSSQVRERVRDLQKKHAKSEPPGDSTEDEDTDEDEEVDEEADDSAEADETDDTGDSDDEGSDPDAIDPLGQGAPCPVCRAARPPREGKLLAVPNRGALRGAIAATTGLLGLSFWSLVQSDSTTDTNRCVDALHKACGDPAKSKATGYVYGRPIVATVIDARPFDGHVLRYGNQDSKVYEGKKWVEGAAKYGPDHGPPSAAARAAPYYIRELQEDLIWLGYFSINRGTPTPGKFDIYTLGAVLGFKQDLIEVYGIGISDKMQALPPGTLLPEQFNLPIWSQKRFIGPVRILLDWSSQLSASLSSLRTIVARFEKRLSPAKTTKVFRAGLASVAKLRGTLETVVEGWPHLAPLERVTESFFPFAPKAATKTVDELPPMPPGRTPACQNLDELVAHEVWSSREYNARATNRDAFKPKLRSILTTIESISEAIAEVRRWVDELTPLPAAASEWDAAAPTLEPVLARLEKLLPLVRHWTLDSPRQLNEWLAHIVDMGTVDQATAVYLKALRQGGRIGPHRRPAYQLAALTAKDDYPSVDAGARALREHCLGRKANAEGRSATTMPEIIALQFFGNESRMQFTSPIGNYTTFSDRGARVVKVGVDTNAHRKGSFDAVFHAGGDWFWSRGWGIGQVTERDGKKDGIVHRRGLPIMPANAETVQHHKAYVDYRESIPDAIESKVLPKYNGDDLKRDCSYGKLVDGDYYDCHTCLKRFFDAGLVGSGAYGQGGIFVPTKKGSAGGLKGATGFFVDFERYTPYARGKDGVEDPAARFEYETWFRTPVEAPSDDVAAALRLLNGKRDYETAAAAVAKARKVDQAVILAGLRKHIADRSQLPCSWLRVRIRYAGSGEQAFASLFKLLRVVGALQPPVPPPKPKPPKPPKKKKKGEDEAPPPPPPPEPEVPKDPIIQNIIEASELRRKS